MVAGKLEEGPCIWKVMIVATPLFALNYSEFFQFSKKQIIVLPLFTLYGIFIFFLIAVEARGSRHVTTGALLIGLQQGGWASRFRKEANSDSRYYSPLQNLSAS